MTPARERDGRSWAPAGIHSFHLRAHRAASSGTCWHRPDTVCDRPRMRVLTTGVQVFRGGWRRACRCEDPAASGVGLMGTTIRHPAVASSLTALTIIVAGCSAASPAQSLTSPSQTSSATPTDSSSTRPTAASNAVAEASTAALTVYRAFWSAQVASDAAPGTHGTGVSRFAVDQALAAAQANLVLFRANGIAMRGAPTLTPVVTSVTLAQPPTVSIRDCLDSTHWAPVYTATGQSALAPGQPRRVVVMSTATIYDGHWVINSSTIHRDEPC